MSDQHAPALMGMIAEDLSHTQHHASHQGAPERAETADDHGLVGEDQPEWSGTGSET